MLAGSRLQLTAVHTTPVPLAAADEPLALVPTAAGRIAGDADEEAGSAVTGCNADDADEEASSAAALPGARRISTLSFVAINAASGQPRLVESTPVTCTLVAMGVAVPQHLPTPAPTPHGQRTGAAGAPPSAMADSGADAMHAQTPALDEADEMDEADGSDSDTSMPDDNVPMTPTTTAVSSQATPVSRGKKRKHRPSNLIYHGEAKIFEASVCCSYLWLTRRQRVRAACHAYLAARTTRMTGRQRRAGSRPMMRQAASTAGRCRRRRAVGQLTLPVPRQTAPARR
jgi:hypothetical protein